MPEAAAPVAGNPRSGMNDGELVMRIQYGARIPGFSPAFPKFHPPEKTGLSGNRFSFRAGPHLHLELADSIRTPKFDPFYR